jgi:putative restriction endonuclease
MFDYGGFTIGDDLSLIGLEGNLMVVKGHLPDADCLKYRREHY